MRRLVGLIGVCAFFATQAAAASDALERGRYLVETVVACGNCHTPFGPNGPDAERNLAGRFLTDEPPFTAYAGNITPDPETGIGGWTKSQLIDAIRNGRRPDGTLIGPPMPFEFYRGISDADVAAIADYVLSLPPVRNEVPKSIYRIPLPPSYGPNVVSVSAPAGDDAVSRGAYLAGPLGHCLECHTPMGAGGHREFETRLGAGGFPFPGPWGVSVSANITSDAEDGLGAWSDDEIKRAITHGVSRDGRALFPPMGYGYYARMSGEDLDAIVAFLRTLPPLKSE